MSKQLALDRGRSPGRNKTSKYKAGPDRLMQDRIMQFRKWLEIYFIQKGRYKITQRGLGELDPKLVRMDTHFGEDNSSRERSSKEEVLRPMKKKEVSRAVNRIIEEAIREGRAKEFYDKGYLVIAKCDWSTKQNRVAAVKKLIEILEINIRELNIEHFESFGLFNGLLRKKYKKSPYLTLVEAGYAYSFRETLEHARTGNFQNTKSYPWEMKVVPYGFYLKKENRIAAIKWLAWKMKQEGKEPRDIIQQDFLDNGLFGLIPYYMGSPFDMLFGVGLVTQKDEEHMRGRGTIKANILNKK